MGRAHEQAELNDGARSSGALMAGGIGVVLDFVTSFRRPWCELAKIRFKIAKQLRYYGDRYEERKGGARSMKHAKRIAFYTRKVAQFRSLPEYRKELRQRRLLAYKREMHKRFEAEPIEWWT